ncbi:hypothetical protein PAXRUDRAFT_155718, partial [Paxillus rubicundulus Ve08.2h10]
VCFFFQLQLHENMEPVSLALISAYSPPNYNDLIDSSGSLFTCTYIGTLSIVKVSQINQVVCITQHPGTDKLFMFEQPGNDVTFLGGFLVTNEDNEDIDGMPQGDTT